MTAQQTCRTRRLMWSSSRASCAAFAAMAAATDSLTGMCTSRLRSSRPPRRSTTCEPSHENHAPLHLHEPWLSNAPYQCRSGTPVSKHRPHSYENNGVRQPPRHTLKAICWAGCSGLRCAGPLCTPPAAAEVGAPACGAKTAALPCSQQTVAVRLPQSWTCHEPLFVAAVPARLAWV